MKNDNRTVLDQLVERWLDGELDDEARAQLNFLLRDDESNRTYFNALIDMQVELRRSGPLEVSTVIPAVTLSSSKRLGPLRWLLNLSIAASVIVAFFGLAYWFATSEENRLAKVTFIEVLGAELFDGQIISAGSMADVEKDYVLTAGMLHLRFPTGAEAILKGPSVFRVTGKESMLVKLGSCSVHAPDGAEGFVVETPQTEVVDLGTRFAVDVNEVGQTDIQLLEGAAEVSPILADKNLRYQAAPHLLRTGEAVRFDASDDDLMQKIPFDNTTYNRSLPDRIVAYEYDDPATNLLTKVTVQRNGEPIDYEPAELTRIRVVHFAGPANAMNVAAAAKSEGNVVSFLEKDDSLITGLINPGGAKTPLTQDPLLATALASEQTATPGLGFSFAQPVVNSHGPDVVFFELNSRVDAFNGDGFHVCPLKFREGLRATTIDRYDITMRSAAALPAADFILPVFPDAMDYLTCSTKDATGFRSPSLQFYILAVGIDLSDLGYAFGETCDGLFIQDDANDQRQVDPVFIAGLPTFDNTRVQGDHE